jgi:hypothetical protein
MVEIVTCPACQRKLQLAGADWDQSVQCPQCAHTFVAGPTPLAAPPAPSIPVPTNGDDLDIERRHIPRDYEPHRGPLIKGLGLFSLVGGVLFLGLPLVVGPVAWALGSRDLRAIDDGHMDPKGRKQTRTGRWCGIAASVLLLLGLTVVVLLQLLA